MKAVPSGKSISSLQGAIQGMGYGFHCYAGPKPPKGKSHKYCFTVYVLDCKLDLSPFSFKRKTTYPFKFFHFHPPMYPIKYLV